MINIEKEIDLYIKRKHYKQVNSVLVYQDGEITIKRYYNGFNEDSRNVIRSVVKSILSIVTGICLDKGIINSLDDPICNYLPQFKEGLDPMHRTIRIKHLLTMTSGIYWVGGVHYHCPQLTELRRCKDWVSHIADTAVVSVPGTKYNYKEYDVILLTALLENAIGSDFYDFLDENLYKKLNIYSGRWWRCTGGEYYSVGYGGEGNDGIEEKPSNLTAMEMMRIGQLFLNEGQYNGEQIVSKEYINKAIAPSNCNDKYGYLWWLGDNWYGCRGFGGQNITVMPDKNRIFVIQATPTSRGMEYDDIIDYVNEFI